MAPAGRRRGPPGAREESMHSRARSLALGVLTVGLLAPGCAEGATLDAKCSSLRVHAAGKLAVAQLHCRAAAKDPDACVAHALSRFDAATSKASLLACPP